MAASAGRVHRTDFAFGSQPNAGLSSTSSPLRAVSSTQSLSSLSPRGWTTKLSPSSQELISASSFRVAQSPTVREVVGVTSSSPNVPGLIT